MKYEILKDKIKGKYIVWEVHKNYSIERYHGYKYQCKEWLKNAKR